MDWRSNNFFLFNSGSKDAELKSIVGHFRGFLDAYKPYGLNAVSLTWAVPVDPDTGKLHDTYENMPDYYGGQPSARLLRKLTGIAHDEGFKVIWKPHFVTDEPEPDNVKPTSVNKGFDAEAFVANVKAYWKKLAPVAEGSDTDLLILGTEHEAYWDKVWLVWHGKLRPNGGGIHQKH